MGIFFEGAPGTAVGPNDGREAKVTDHGMTILRQKNIFRLQVPVEDVMRVKIIDGPQYLLDIKMSDVNGKATGIVDLVPEVSRVYRLMNERNDQNVGSVGKR